MYLLLASLFNVTFAVNGNIVPNSVQLDNVVCVIKEDTLLTTVCLHSFPLTRLPVSLGNLPTLDEELLAGILIEPGFWLYEGGNVTIFLLSHGLYLFSFLGHTHLL